jgi:tetratricopeptide (TPR) repeat protein
MTTAVVVTPGVTAQPAITPAASATPQDFSAQGEAQFKAGDYKAAIQSWRHAIVDDPQNPLLIMMMGQALFAAGSYDEAAGATQAAMQLLPKDKWGVVASNYKELYGNMQDYTDQLRALEKAVKDKPDNPAQRFLLGFHYAYLGFPKESIDQLDRGLKIAPQDEGAKQLRDLMRAKVPQPEAPAASPTPQAPSAFNQLQKSAARLAA